MDADACPVREIIERVSQEYGVEVWMYMDFAHEGHFAYARLRQVDTAKDAADLALINDAEKGDIVVTQDYGLASLALGKGAYALHPGGMRYTTHNIDRLLAERHFHARTRGHVRTRAFPKRTREDDRRFEQAYRKLLEELTA